MTSSGTPRRAHRDKQAVDRRAAIAKSMGRKRRIQCDCGEEDFWASIVPGRNPAPVLQTSEHDLDLVAAFVATLVVLDGLAARLPARNAGLYPLVFQCFSEPVGVISPVSEQPICLWQAAQQRRRAGVITDLACRHEEPDRATIGVGDGVQLGVHAALGSTDQTTPLVAGSPFFDRRLVAVRCVLR